jgi:hypothetical protein
MTCTIRPIRSTLEQRPVPLPMTPSDQVLRETAEAAYEDGERFGYLAGWKWGAVCGMTLGTFAGALLVAGAAWLGRWAAGGA